MPNLKIRFYNDPVLRQECEKIEKITPEIRELIEAMKEMMKKDGGVGLAGPQIGITKRIIVVETDKGVFGYINPLVIKQGKETWTVEEGCLSFPGLFLKISRPREAEIKALDEDGNEVIIEAKDWPARIFLHEIDHTNGVLFIDRASCLQKLKKIKKIAEIKKICK